MLGQIRADIRQAGNIERRVQRVEYRVSDEARDWNGSLNHFSALLIGGSGDELAGAIRALLFLFEPASL